MVLYNKLCTCIFLFCILCTVYTSTTDWFVSVEYKYFVMIVIGYCTRWILLLDLFYNATTMDDPETNHVSHCSLIKHTISQDTCYL